MIIICIFVAVVFTYQNIIDTMQENRNSTMASFKEEQFAIIWKYLDGLQTQSTIKVTKVAEDIQNDILSLSDKEFKQIQTDMTAGQENAILHKILIKNIENVSLNSIKNHRNGIIVMSNDGYIEDYNYRRAYKAKDNSTLRKWQDSIDGAYNKELEKNAIDKIINRTSGIIASESYDLIGDENHIMIKELTHDSLFEVYSKEGLNGLRNYQIFIPYYITDIEDIFGVPDIVQGVKTDNNKIIVVQEFNIYDQLVKNHYDDIFNNTKVTEVMYRYDNVLRWLYVFAVLIATAICILMFWACTYYNMIIEQEHKCCQEVEEILDTKDKLDDISNE